uniref:Uncharacterized protein n=1 Tax=Amphiprion ocellaris TaxID=80972 RepID=A0A3Q1BDZ6_AMPOC
MGTRDKSQVEDLVAVFPQRLHLHTGDAVEQTLELPIPRHTWDAVVAVEQLPPQELISGDSEPLSAGLTGSQHGIVGQTQEDLQHQAVWQSWGFFVSKEGRLFQTVCLSSVTLCSCCCWI